MDEETMEAQTKWRLTEEEHARRAEIQRQMRDEPLHEPDPAVNPLVSFMISQQEKPLSTFHFECACGCPIATRAVMGTCPSCGFPFDLSGWGR